MDLEKLKFVEMMLLPTEAGHSPLSCFASVISVHKAATVLNSKAHAFFLSFYFVLLIIF